MKLVIPFDPPVLTRDISIKVYKNKLNVTVKGKPPIIDGCMYAPVLYDEIMWQVRFLCTNHEVFTAVSSNNN